VNIELQDVLQRMRDKSYFTLGEAFEDLLSDALSMNEGPLPEDLRQVAEHWESRNE
jgi:hypothetical protein